MTGATLIVRKGNQFALCKVRCDGYDLPDAVKRIDRKVANTPLLYCKAYIAYHVKDIIPSDEIINKYNATVEKYNEALAKLPKTDDTSDDFDELDELGVMQDLQRECGVTDAQGDMITWMAQLELTRRGTPFEFEMDVPAGLSADEIYNLASNKADELMWELGEKFEDYLCSYEDYAMLVDLDASKVYKF